LSLQFAQIFLILFEKKWNSCLNSNICLIAIILMLKITSL
jgi:hypothetical protein